MGQPKIIDDEYFDDRLQCYVRDISYNFTHRRGVVHLGDFSCTDMSGCIAMFTGIDKRVRLIETLSSDGKGDTYYVSTRSGWQAFRGQDIGVVEGAGK